MTQEQINNWLYYLQCKYSTWSTSFSNALSYGTCIDSFIENNITISNLFGPIHRYVAFTDTVTNAFSLSFTELIADTSVTVKLTINGYSIAYATSVNDPASILTYILGEVNDNTATHGYLAVLDGESLYIYTYDSGETFTDIPTIVITEHTSGLSGDSLSSSTSTLENDLDVILDTWNCLTVEQICAVKTKLNSLLGNCNCN